MSALAYLILLLGDLLAIAAVGIACLVFLSVVLMSIGRVRLGETTGYWFLSLFLHALLGTGLVAKWQTADIAPNPNGLLLQLSNNTLLTLLGLGLAFLVGSLGLFLYLWNH